MAKLLKLILLLKMNYQKAIKQFWVKGYKIVWRTKAKNRYCRALYKNPKVLILDEATSALDNITEKKVMNNIFSKRKNHYHHSCT